MKIGLIAMSGVRACDPELMELGLTLPGFVERSKVVASMPSLGLLTLAGMTPREHDVRYLEVADLRDAQQLPTDFDLVAISSYSAQIFEAYQLASRYRAMGVEVVMGGIHVSHLPAEAGRHCDAVVIGEGEASWLEVIRDAERGDLQPRYGAFGTGYSLADAPMPAFELLDLDRYNRLTVQTSRGCPLKCEFCASSPIMTGRYKQKPAEKVLAEIDRIKERWDHPFLEFADDNAMVNKRYWRDFLPELKKRQVRWFAETDISIAEDRGLLRSMRESGCAQVLIGLESPAKSDLSGLELHSDWKHKRWERYRQAINAIQDEGITVNGCFVLGLDGQTSSVFDQVFDFVRDTELYEVQVTILTAFPGTPLHSRLAREGRILEPERWDLCTLFDLNLRPTHMDLQEFRAGFRDLVKRLYSQEFTDWRRSRFVSRRRKVWNSGKYGEELLLCKAGVC